MMFPTILVFGLFILASSEILFSPFKPNDNEHGNSTKNSGSFAESCKFGDYPELPECNATNITKLSQFQATFSACVLNETDLQQLVDLVTDAITAVTPLPNRTRGGFVSAAPRCELECTLERIITHRLTKSSWEEGPCKNLFNTIRTLLLSLKQTIVPLVPLHLAITNPKDYCLYVEEMENKKLTLQNTLCSLEFNMTTNITELYTKLWKQQSCFFKQWNCAVSNIDDLMDSLRDSRLLHLISLLQAGRLTDLNGAMNRLNDWSIIGPLINGAYGAKYMEHISQFVDLLKNSRLSAQRFVVYNTTLHAMITAKDHLSNVILLLKQMVDKEPLQNMTGLDTVKELVDRFVGGLFIGWVIDIQKNDCAPIIEFGSPQIVNRAGLSFLTILPELLSKVYGGDEENRVPLLKFVTALRWNKHKGVGLIELQKLFVTTGQQIQLALLVQDTLNGNLTGPDTDAQQDVENSLEQLKQNFPLVVKNVVFSERCKIGALNIGSYSTTRDFIQRFTSSGTGTGNDWEFQPLYIESRGEYIFRIRHTNGEYLMADFFWQTYSDGSAPTATSILEPCGDERFYGWKVDGEDVAQTSAIQLYHLGRDMYLRGSALVWEVSGGITLSCTGI